VDEKFAPIAIPGLHCMIVGPIPIHVRNNANIRVIYFGDICSSNFAPHGTHQGTSYWISVSTYIIR